MDPLQYKKLLEDFQLGKLKSLEIPNYLWYSELKQFENFKLQPNLTLKEFNVSIAKRVGKATKNNSPLILINKDLIFNTQKLLDHIKTKYPKAYIISESGYRSIYVNSLIGGAGASKHTQGCALDCRIVIPELSGKLTPDAIRRGVLYEAYKLNLFGGYELILGGSNFHVDIRSGKWFSEQYTVNGIFKYRNVDPLKAFKPYKLPAF